MKNLKAKANYKFMSCYNVLCRSISFVVFFFQASIGYFFFSFLVIYCYGQQCFQCTKKQNKRTCNYNTPPPRPLRLSRFSNKLFKKHISVKFERDSHKSFLSVRQNNVNLLRRPSLFTAFCLPTNNTPLLYCKRNIMYVSLNKILNVSGLKIYKYYLKMN